MESSQTGAPDEGGVDKITFLHRSSILPVRRLTAENIYPSTTVVRVHKGALAEEYAV